METSSILLNNISLTAALVKFERKVCVRERERDDLETIIRGLGIFGISLEIDQAQSAHTPLQFKLNL